MFPDYTTVANFHRLPHPDRRQVARDAEIRLRIKRTLNRQAA
jgi:hypothetical protein